MLECKKYRPDHSQHSGSACLYKNVIPEVGPALLEYPETPDFRSKNQMPGFRLSSHGRSDSNSFLIDVFRSSRCCRRTGLPLPHHGPQASAHTLKTLEAHPAFPVPASAPRGTEQSSGNDSNPDRKSGAGVHNGFDKNIEIPG